MGLVGRYEYVLKDSSDKIYNFFINHREQLECIFSNRSNQWIDKTIVSSKSCQHFAVAMDSQDRIHALIIHTNGDITYYWQLEKGWRNRKITTINRGIENVYYPDIAILNDQVHLFYLHQKTTKVSICSVIHTCKHHGKWNSMAIEAITYSKYINPFKILNYNNKLHLLCASHNSVCEECFLTILDNENNKWGHPIKLTSSDDRKIYLDGLIDEAGILHMTWSMLEEDGLTVKYQQQALSKLTGPSDIEVQLKTTGKTSDEICQLLIDESIKIDDIISGDEAMAPIKISEHHNCSFPYIIVLNKILWIVWFQFNCLVSSYSKDNGLTWSTPNLITKTKLMSFKRYRFFSNSKNDKRLMKCDYLFGTLYPNIQFIGFGGDINDDLSKNSQ